MKNLMKALLSHSISGVAGNIIMILAIISFIICWCTCTTPVDVAEGFIGTLGMAIGISLIDITIAEEKHFKNTEEVRYIKVETNLNW